MGVPPLRGRGGRSGGVVPLSRQDLYRSRNFLHCDLQLPDGYGEHLLECFLVAFVWFMVWLIMGIVRNTAVKDKRKVLLIFFIADQTQYVSGSDLVLWDSCQQKEKA